MFSARAFWMARRRREFMVGVGRAELGGDGDFARQLREELRAPRVGGALPVHDVLELRMTGHAIPRPRAGWRNGSTMRLICRPYRSASRSKGRPATVPVPSNDPGPGRRTGIGALRASAELNRARLPGARPVAPRSAPERRHDLRTTRRRAAAARPPSRARCRRRSRPRARRSSPARPPGVKRSPGILRRKRRSGSSLSMPITES